MYFSACLSILMVLVTPSGGEQFEECCRVVMIKSAGLGAVHQPHRLGVYTKISAKLNSHPVYKVMMNYRGITELIPFHAARREGKFYLSLVF